MAEPKKHFLAEIEERMLGVWEQEKTFEKSLKARSSGQPFNFYDGPPFANGIPHYGHFVQTTIKDAVTRYKTMRGYRVPRRVGWDAHGLPVEYAIEKEHGFKSKRDIVEYGIDKFNQASRESVFKHKDVWEKTFRRVGRWADYDKTYATLDESYIESVWWVFKTIYDKGLVYQDFRSSPYCPRCATPLSNFELNQGYQDDVADPSLYVKFKLNDEDAYLLGWTTTPWSLPGNVAVAVKPDARYVYVALNDDEGRVETLVLARERLAALNSDTYRIVKEVDGKELAGRSYAPLFDLGGSTKREDLYKVWGADFVSTNDGSGLLHIAPAFGEDDLALAKDKGLPVLLTIDEDGRVVSDMGLPPAIAGQFFKAADRPIIAHLTRAGLVYAAETIKHTYPFCWRCDTPLLYYATDTWLVRVSELRDRLVANNKTINWVPAHIRDKRFGNWLEGARDWSISRNRFWGAPLPVWVTDDGEEVVVIGSVEELRSRAINPDQVNDLHRPHIDNVKIKTNSGKIARRIPEVFDCWFESGSMPYAQDHYPFDNAETWAKNFPADFVAEAIDQTRGWFYTLHVLATALFDKPAFLNVICSGWVVAADGEKLSKRKKNYAPMDEVFDRFGVDTLRFFMVSSPIVNGEDVRFSVDYLGDVQRKVFMTLHHTFSFYKLYADVDGWKPGKTLEEPKSDHLLDRWIKARLSETIAEVTTNMDNYRLDKATRPLVDLLDDVSNWYVRRSRRRFWKTENDRDKQQAYATLHYCLVRLCQLLAPFAPFLSDHVWRQLVPGTDLPESVHLSDWPETARADEQLIQEMAKVRGAITEGLAQRASAKIKVRQPLAKVSVPKVPEIYKDIIAEELNVQDVVWGKSVAVDVRITPKLKRKGLARDVIRQVQSARKSADLRVDDRIDLLLQTQNADLAKAIKEHAETIARETLTARLVSRSDRALFTAEAQIDGIELKIALSRSSQPDVAKPEQPRQAVGP